MRYPTIDEEMTTHQHVDIPSVDALNIGRNSLASDDMRRSATEDDTAHCNVASAPTTRPQTMPRNLGVAVAMALLAIVGILAWQVIGSSNNGARTTFNDVARQLDSLTPPAKEHNAAAAAQAESTPSASHQALLTAGANLLKEIQQMRERWVDRTDKTIGTLKAHREMFSIVLTEAQSNVLQEYIGKFERLHADGMAQFAAMENDLLEPTSIHIRFQRLKQLDQEWKETGKEFGRRGREVGLK